MGLADRFAAAQGQNASPTTQVPVPTPLPEEARMGELSYAAGVAVDFVRGLASAGTTSALVFGAHYAPAVDALTRLKDRVATALFDRMGARLNDPNLSESQLRQIVLSELDEVVDEEKAPLTSDERQRPRTLRRSTNMDAGTTS